jgi:hypothetical protein
MENWKDYGEAALRFFKAGFDAAKAKTDEALKKELTPLQKGLVLCGVLLAGILIGYALSARRRKAYEVEEFEEFDD